MRFTNEMKKNVKLPPFNM